MPDEKPTRSDAARNRDLILDAATVVLSRNAEATLSDIAGAAGVSRTTVYRHFADVAEVRAALVAEAEAAGREALQAHMADGLAFTGEHGALSNEMTGFLRAVVGLETRYSRSLAKGTDPEAGLVASFTPFASAVVRRGQASSEFLATLDADLMAQSLISLVLDGVRRIHLDGLAHDLAMQPVTTFLRGMETSPRPSKW